ncbi:MAG: AAA family ATPase [Sulfurovum sp.]|nr:AAA family ATPase [Sulfurovum sp.]
MELQLKNIGMIKEANVKIDGLTVIAGENDTGKSTVGKLLFSIIKSSSRYKEDLEESKEDKILSLIEKAYFRLRKRIDFSSHIDLRDLFYPPKFIRDIDNKAVKAFDIRLEKIKALKEKSLFNIEENIENQYLSNIEKSLLEIKDIYLLKDDKQEAQSRAFKKALISEFKGKISNQNNINDIVKIEASEGENKILDIKMKNDKILSFEIIDDLYFSDATFVETPAVLQMSEVIDIAKTFFEDQDREDRTIRLRKANISLHIKDLHDKLKISFYDDDLFDIEDLLNSSIDIKGLLNRLSEIIGGKIKYLKKEKDFKYITSDGKTYGSINTATGIKSFGIIQMLLKSGLINERSLLVLDEPEVHLHPKWQIKYAELIVELAKNNITILVTSHSPYMIEALKRYSEVEEIEDRTNFYLAEGGVIDKVEDSNALTLEKIFEKLSEPFDVFEEMDSQRMENFING